MIVIVESNLSIKNMFEPPLELHVEEDASTLRGLLQQLDKTCSSLQFFQNGGLGENVAELFLNGEGYRVLRQGLSTRLMDGDRVSVKMSIEPVWGWVKGGKAHVDAPEETVNSATVKWMSRPEGNEPGSARDVGIRQKEGVDQLC